VVYLLAIHSIDNIIQFTDGKKSINIQQLVHSIQQMVHHIQSGAPLKGGKNVRVTIVLMSCAIPMTVIQQHLSFPNVKYVSLSLSLSLSLSDIDIMCLEHYYIY
jgi:hypothetical protein